MTNPNDAHWWRVLNWMWIVCHAGLRYWDHPTGEMEVVELKKHFEETYPDWKKSDGVPEGLRTEQPSGQKTMTEELPF